MQLCGCLVSRWCFHSQKQVCQGGREGDYKFRSHRQSGQFPVFDSVRLSESSFYHQYWSKIHPASCWYSDSKMSQPPICSHKVNDERSREGSVGIKECSSGVPTLSHFQRPSMLVNLAFHRGEHSSFQFSQATATEETLMALMESKWAILLQIVNVSMMQNLMKQNTQRTSVLALSATCFFFLFLLYFNYCFCSIWSHG